jgi:CRISPR/Cas system CSM-associated protein Csm3 (group 7 of RAMP superfamily)
MTPILHHYTLARLTLEAVTPLSITAGGGDGVFDMTLTRDANGLPALPGSTIAGVLRHLFWDLYGKSAMESLFGYQDSGQADRSRPSRLQVSWGCLHDSAGQPVEGLLLGAAGQRLVKDPVLQAALASRESPIHRDRVRIGHRGAASAQGKFDRAVLPAGHRFSAELALWSAHYPDPHWQRLLDLLQHPLFRLGGATRAGLGRLRLIQVHEGHFDLTTEAGRTAFARLPRGIGEIAGLTPATASHTPQARFLTFTLHLTPRSFWRIGQGDAPQKTDGNGKPADLLPKLEQRVVWDRATGEGRLGAAELLVPATSIKGALAHRVAFHANRMAGRWAEELLAHGQEYPKEACDEVQCLFGSARDDGEETGVHGQAGRLLVDDALLAFTKQDVHLMMHNAIDRFTGGVREHMLFMEELVWRKEIEVHGVIDTEEITNAARMALQAALDDLCQGRLSLGSGAGKGHGLFTGTIDWSDQGEWLQAPRPISEPTTIDQKVA